MLSSLEVKPTKIAETEDGTLLTLILKLPGYCDYNPGPNVPSFHHDQYQG